VLSSKEFNEKLNIDNMKELEMEFQKTIKFFTNLNDKIKCDEVEFQFPAYCLINQAVYIKFPTYKIRILHDEISIEEIHQLLKDLNINNYEIYKETNVVLSQSSKTENSIVIHCLSTNLDANTSAADEILKKLKEKKKDIKAEKCVDYGCYCIRINVDEEGYIINAII